MDVVKQICNSLHLPLLPSYIHLTFLDLFICQLIHISLGPRLSSFLFPNHYHDRLDSAQKLDWDIHLTAFSQTTLIFVLGCWVMLFDEERRRMTWQERVWGWTNPAATALAIANGYFLWHLVMMVRYRKVYGWSMVAHAVSVSSIMILGFRPAFMTHAPAAFLYEFSNIFLDIHRFLLKLRMEGTRIQIVNGIALFVAFFLCRILWGTYLTAWFYRDILSAAVSNIEGVEKIPAWLLGMHALSATVLQTLNYVWFWKIARLVYRKLFGWGKGSKDQ